MPVIYSAKGNVQLAMGKNLFSKIKTNARESLALRFINCQGVGEAENKTGHD